MSGHTGRKYMSLKLFFFFSGAYGKCPLEAHNPRVRNLASANQMQGNDFSCGHLPSDKD